MVVLKKKKFVYEKFLSIPIKKNGDSSFIASFVFKPFRWNKNYLMAFVDSHLIHYPAPINLTYAWSFGFTAGICLIIQILSGIFLAMHYTPHIDLAFLSVEGWFKAENH